MEYRKTGYREPDDQPRITGVIAVFRVTQGPEILNQTEKWCLPLRQALDTWGDVTFNYTSTETPDFVRSAAPAC